MCPEGFFKKSEIILLAVLAVPLILGRRMPALGRAGILLWGSGFFVFSVLLATVPWSEPGAAWPVAGFTLAACAVLLAGWGHYFADMVPRRRMFGIMGGTVCSGTFVFLLLEILGRCGAHGTIKAAAVLTPGVIWAAALRLRHRAPVKRPGFNVTPDRRGLLLLCLFIFCVTPAGLPAEAGDIAALGVGIGLCAACTLLLPRLKNRPPPISC